MKPDKRSWSRKFADAFRGTWIAYADNSSFWVHTLCALAVVAAAWWLQLDTLRWAVLVICILAVFSLEAVNTALEELAKAIDQEFNPRVRDALDIGSAAVLIAALGAVVVGVLILLPPLLELLS